MDCLCGLLCVNLRLALQRWHILHFDSCNESHNINNGGVALCRFLRETSDIRLGRLLSAISRENGCAKSLPKNKLSIIYLHSLSIILHKICSISKCISWIRGVDELGTTIFKSTHSFIAPPSRPLKPIILQPLLFAVSRWIQNVKWRFFGKNDEIRYRQYL